MMADRSESPAVTSVAKARHDGVEIAYQTLGPPTGEPLILIMGVGGQMLNWPDDFCFALVDRGFRVGRFDNRDSGLSTNFASAGVPNGLWMLLRPKSTAVYRLEDMADDATSVMDSVGWEAAHVVGFSVGGAIAQMVAIRHPSRVLTLTSISSSPSWRIGRIKISTMLRLVSVARRSVKSPEDAALQVAELSRIAGSPGYPPDQATDSSVGQRMFERGWDQGAWQRQNAALAASGDRRSALARLRVPALVLHGEADSLIQPSGGRATAASIPGARLLMFPGMGHDLPRQLWPTIIDEIRTWPTVVP